MRELIAVLWKNFLWVFPCISRIRTSTTRFKDKKILSKYILFVCLHWTNWKLKFSQSFVKLQFYFIFFYFFFLTNNYILSKKINKNRFGRLLWHSRHITEQARLRNCNFLTNQAENTFRIVFIPFSYLKLPKTDPPTTFPLNWLRYAPQYVSCWSIGPVTSALVGIIRPALIHVC